MRTRQPCGESVELMYPLPFPCSEQGIPTAAMNAPALSISPPGSVHSIRVLFWAWHCSLGQRVHSSSRVLGSIGSSPGASTEPSPPYLLTFRELGLGSPFLSLHCVHAASQAGASAFFSPIIGNCTGFPEHLALLTLVLWHYLIKLARTIYSSPERQQPLHSQESGTLRH